MGFRGDGGEPLGAGHYFRRRIKGFVLLGRDGEQGAGGSVGGGGAHGLGNAGVDLRFQQIVQELMGDPLARAFAEDHSAIET